MDSCAGKLLADVKLSSGKQELLSSGAAANFCHISSSSFPIPFFALWSIQSQNLQMESERKSLADFFPCSRRMHFLAVEVDQEKFSNLKSGSTKLAKNPCFPAKKLL